MKYTVEVGSFCTRFIQRNITVDANNEIEASAKAISMFVINEMELENYNDFGSPRVGSIICQDKE